MSGNLSRIYPLFKNDTKLIKLFQAIDKKYPNYELGANTPLPNQIFETAKNPNGNDMCIYLKPQATKVLKWIRQTVQNRFIERKALGKEDRPLEFVCLGYMDYSHDIVIDQICVPLIDYLSETDSTYDGIMKRINKAIPSKDANIETLSTYYDYLRDTKYNNKDKIGIMPVALFGTTRPIINYPDKTENCMRFGELAKSIVPGNISFDHQIISGIMSVSPNYIIQSPNGNQLKAGSLECLITEYNYNKNGEARPSKLYNVTRCQEADMNEKLSIVDISKSYQNLNNLPILEGQEKRTN